MFTNCHEHAFNTDFNFTCMYTAFYYQMQVELQKLVDIILYKRVDQSDFSRYGASICINCFNRNWPKCEAENLDFIILGSGRSL